MRDAYIFVFGLMGFIYSMNLWLKYRKKSRQESEHFDMHDLAVRMKKAHLMNQILRQEKRFKQVAKSL